MVSSNQHNRRLQGRLFGHSVFSASPLNLGTEGWVSRQSLPALDVYIFFLQGKRKREKVRDIFKFVCAFRYHLRLYSSHLFIR